MTQPKKTAKIVVNRANQGVATFKLYIDGVEQALSTTVAHWDDVTPWSAGSYSAHSEPYGGNPNSPAYLLENVAGRSAIKFHAGVRPDNSEGCIVVKSGTIAEINKLLADNDIERSDLIFDITGNYGFGFKIHSNTQKVYEGGKISLTISLTGAGTEDGVSKDVWVHVKPIGTGELGKDFAPANPEKLPKFPLAHGSTDYPVDGPGFWVLLPKGPSGHSKDIQIDVKNDNIRENTETVKFQIDGYKIVDNNPGAKIPKRFYTPSNYRTILNQVLYDVPFTKILDKPSTVSLTQNGGYEGFFRTITTAPGEKLKLNFDAYSIPDKLRIWDADTGTEYVNFGFGSNTYANEFTVDEQGSGRLRVAVQGSSQGTAWSVQLASLDAEPSGSGSGGGFPPTALLSFASTPSAAASFEASDPAVNAVSVVFGDTMLDVRMSGSDLYELTPADIAALEEDPTEALDISVTRRGDLAMSLSIGWRVEPIGGSPVDAADFGGVFPSGMLTFAIGESDAAFSFEAIDDGIIEGIEHFRVVFFDLTTGALLVAADNGPQALAGSIMPTPTGVLYGTDVGDTLTGDADDNDIFGGDGNDILDGGAGDDYIDGDAGNDVLIGGAGRDYLRGGEGSDTYRVNDGSGAFSFDTVDDDGSRTDTDTLDLGEIGSARLVFSADGRDLIVSNLDTLYAVRVVGQLSGNGVETFTYMSNAVAMTLDRAQLAVLTGQRRYELGDGDLLIDAANENAGARLLLGEGIGLETVTLERPLNGTNDLLIHVADGSTIRLYQIFSSSSAGGFDGVEFGDGSFYSSVDLQPLAVVRGTTAADVINLDGGDDLLEGGLGDDALAGGSGADTYRYFLGDGADVVDDGEILRDGSSSSDDGENVLRLMGVSPDSIVIDRDGDSVYIRLPDGGSVLLRHQLSLDLIHRAATSIYAGGVARIEFDDQTIWDREAIKAVLGFIPPAFQIFGSENGDVLTGDYWENDIYGLGGNDVIDGGEEADLIDGGEGADTIVGGAGNDILIGGAGNDVILAGDGDDLVVAVDGDGDDILSGAAGADTLDYSAVAASVTVDFINSLVISSVSGRDMIDGFEKAITGAGADTLIGSAADEILVGGAGSDTYVVTSGLIGHDVIVDQAGATDVNAVLFTNVNPGDIRIVYANANGVSVDARAASVVAQVIEIIATGERIRIPVDGFRFDDEGERLFGINHIVFANGVEWTAAEIAGSIPAGAFVGTNGDDILAGTSGADYFVAGKGDDSIEGHAGSDVYRYASGSGNDHILDAGDASDVDALLLTNLKVAEIELRHSGYDLFLRDLNTGQDIRIESEFYGGPEYGIEEIRFADGTVWDRTRIGKEAWYRGTGASDDLRSTDRDDTFLGGTGDDYLEGGGGSDVYRYASGDGSDRILDAGGASDMDALALIDLKPSDVELRRSGYDLFVRDLATGQDIRVESEFYNGAQYGIEEIRFAGGTVWDRARIASEAWFRGTGANDDIRSTDQSDTIIGGKGDDYLEGRGGGDVYHYASGDGSDEINDAGSASDVDSLSLTDLDPEAITLRRDGMHLFVTEIATGVEVKVDNQFYGNGQYGIERIAFADGSVWDRARIALEIDATHGTRGDDVIAGLAGADTIFAGRGNDWLDGGSGDDKLFGEAGNDVVQGGLGNDTLVGGDGDDTIYGDRYGNAPAGANMIVNGGFEIAGQGADDTGFGRRMSNMPGWIKANSQAFEQHASGYMGVTATDGSYWLDLDSGGGNGSNMNIGQTIGGLTEGASLVLSFDHANRTSASSGSFNVFWNETLVATIDDTGTTMRTTTLDVTAIAGDNLLRFVGTGDADNTGASLDRVTLRATQPAQFSGDGNDIIDGGNGDDIITGGLGNDKIEGGTGHDVAVFSGRAGQYQVSAGPAGSYVVRGADGVDTLTKVEELRFADGKTVALSSGNIAPVELSIETAKRVEFTYIGTALQEMDRVYRLTPAKDDRLGAIWSPIDLSYDVHWTSRMYFGRSNSGADGITFALQGIGTNLTGGNGVLADGTVGISFDTYRNDGEPDSDFSVFEMNGAYNSAFDTYHLHGNLETRSWHNVTIDWNANTHTLSYTLDGRAVASKTTDLIALFGSSQAYFGFGARTGDRHNYQAVDLESVVTQSDHIVVDPGAAAGTLLAKLKGLDLNAGDTFIYTITDANGIVAPNPNFTIVNGNELRVAASASLSALAGSTIDLFIQVKDQSGAKLVSPVHLDFTGSPHTTPDVPELNEPNEIYGTPGDDYLEGGAGSDIYYYRSGEGNDRIVENGNVGDVDIIALKNLNPANVELRRSGNDLWVRDLTTGKDIRIDRQFDADGTWGIEQIKFADDTTWDREAIRQAAWFRSGDGGEEVYASGIDDTLVGNKGNDYLVGGAGGDTYRYASGDGSDRIYDEGVASDVDTLKLTDLNAANVQLRRWGNELYLRDLATGQEIRVDRQFQDDAAWGLNQIVFADSTTWDREAIRQAAWFRGGDGGEEVYASDIDDTLVGNKGNDYLVGGAGGDTYRYASGDGSDRIYDEGAAGDVDTLKLTDLNAANVELKRWGNELYVRDLATGQEIRVDRQFQDDGTWGLNQIVFADGVTLDREAIRQAAWFQGGDGGDEVYASGIDDTLVGNKGNDYLVGGAGGDTYRYASGDGSDRIYDEGAASDVDTLKLTDLNAANVELRRWGNELYVRDLATGQEIRVDRQFQDDGSWGLNQIVFADDTTWDREAIRQAAWFRSGDGGDEVYASGIDDTLVGNKGNDYLVGGAGGDTYRYASGDGSDRIYDEGVASDVDTLKLTDLNAVNVQLRRWGNELYLRDLATGHEIRVDRQFQDDGTWGLNQIVFADGITLDREQIRRGAVFYGGDGGDEIYGSGLDDTLQGEKGNDYLEGREGSDTYRYASGDGSDTIADRSDNVADIDVLKLTNLNASNVQLRRAGNDMWVRDLTTGQEVRVSRQFQDDGTWGLNQIVFADGITLDREQIRRGAVFYGGDGGDEIYGSGLDDTLQGEKGNDYLEGREGSDTYRYASGDGSDTIADRSDNVADIDVLKLTNLNASNVQLRRAGNDMWVRDLTTGQEVRVSRQFQDDGTWGLNQIVFADGITLDREQIRRGAVFYGGDGGDEIYGSGLDDTLQGEKGNDYLEGREGSDTYRYASGDGSDTIADLGAASDSDRLSLVDLIAGDVEFHRANDDLFIRDSNTGQEIKVNRHFQADGSWGLNEIVFADGAIWTREQIANRLTGATDAGDTLIGGASADFIRGLGGADTIRGLDGADELRGDAGDDRLQGDAGSDLLVGGAGNDVLEGDTYGLVATSENLLVNGSFEQSGSIAFTWNDGLANDTMIGWVKANSQVFEQIYSGHASTTATDGGYWLDLDSGGGAGSNMDISQTVSGLVAGKDVLLQFDHNNRTNNPSGTFEVWWNGTLVTTIEARGADMRTTSLSLVAAGGDNVLRFVGLGDQDNAGAGLDNVRLFEAAWIRSGNGDDVLDGGAGSDLLNGGAGTDVARFAGNYADYQLATSGGVLTVTDLAPGVDGDDGVDQLTGIETLRFRDGDISLVAPIVLDLDGDGDGVELIDRAASVARIDLNMDGAADRTSWVSRDDALLFLDRNGNGSVDGIDEISFVGDVAGATSNLARIAAFDTNGDGKRGSGNAGYNAFGLWRSRNGNGFEDVRELSTLFEKRVASIGLVGRHTDVTSHWEAGVVLNEHALTQVGDSSGTTGGVMLSFVRGGSIAAAASRLTEAAAVFGVTGATAGLSLSTDGQETLRSMVIGTGETGSLHRSVFS